jgi:hypothetical protein
VFRILRERQNKIAHQLAGGAICGCPEAEFFQAHGEAVGRYREIDDLINMEFENVKEAE